MCNGKGGKGGKNRKLKSGTGGSAIAQASGGKGKKGGKGGDDIDAILAELNKADKEKADAEARRVEQQRQAQVQRAKDLVDLGKELATLALPGDLTASEKSELEGFIQRARKAHGAKNVDDLRGSMQAFRQRCDGLGQAKLDATKLRDELDKIADPEELGADEGKVIVAIRKDLAAALDERQIPRVRKSLRALRQAISKVHRQRVRVALETFDAELQAAREEAEKADGYRQGDLDFLDRYADSQCDVLGGDDPVEIGKATSGLDGVAKHVAKLAAARSGKTMQRGTLQQTAPGRPLTINRVGGAFAVLIDTNHPRAGLGDEVEFLLVDASVAERDYRAEIIGITKTAAPDYSKVIAFETVAYEWAGTATKHFNDGYLTFDTVDDIKAFLIARRASVEKTVTPGIYRLASNSGATGRKPLDAIIFDYDHGAQTLKVFHVQ